MDSLLHSKIVDKNCNYFGLSSSQLMESAGKVLASSIQKDFGTKKKVAIFCGLGNNGGDGFVLARYLAKNNSITIHLLGSSGKIPSEEAFRNFLIAKNSKIKIFEYSDSKELPKKLNADLIVEALLGAGLKGPIKEPFKSAVALMNSTKAKRIAVDHPIPSLKFHKVYSLAEKKHSKAKVLDIGIPEEFNYLAGPGHVKFLAKRKETSHKGENGSVLILAGSKQYHGAAVFAGKAASLFSDLVFLLSEKENLPILKKASAEFIVSELNQKSVQEFVQKSNSILIGPGLAINSKNKKITNYLLKNYKNKKFILDASAFSLINKKLLSKNCILTPHRKEFKKLFRKEPSEKNVLSCAKKFNCNILLKSPIDLFSDGKNLYFNFSGNSGLTTGGTGDLLAGTLAAFACKNNLTHSALAAIFLIGFTGDLLKSERGLTFNAENVFFALPEAKKICEEY